MNQIATPSDKFSESQQIQDLVYEMITLAVKHLGMNLMLYFVRALCTITLFVIKPLSSDNYVIFLLETTKFLMTGDLFNKLAYLLTLLGQRAKENVISVISNCAAHIFKYSSDLISLCGILILSLSRPSFPPSSLQSSLLHTYHNHTIVISCVVILIIFDSCRYIWVGFS